MNEEKKRTLALFFMKQEQSRLLDAHSALDAAAANINTSLTHSTKVREALSLLAQRGITWDELHDAYHTAFNDGHHAMMAFKLSFFTLEWRLPSMRDSTQPRKIPQISSIKYTKLPKNPRIDLQSSNAAEKKQAWTPPYLMKSAHSPPSHVLISSSMASRKDRVAVERMRRSGITPKDLEYETRIGYNNGWNADVGMSICYGCAALA